jgi:regulator of sirC expression with transglutaminase-like and TPR domain
MNSTTEETMLVALLKLLDDPDPEVFTQIENKVVEIGSLALPYLNDAAKKNADHLSDNRIKTLLQKIQFNKAQNAFKEWKLKSNKSLIEAALILAEFHYPELDSTIVLQKIEKLKRDIWLELNEEFTALEKIHILNHVFYKIYRFTGNKTNISQPQNSLISDLMDKRQGNSVILGILYQEIAQSLELPVHGVNLPENFILSYLNSEQMLSDTRVLFYINPFNNGIVFTREDIDVFISQLELDQNQNYYEPCIPENTIVRLMNELVQSYELLGEAQKKSDLNQLIRVLS